MVRPTLFAELQKAEHKSAAPTALSNGPTIIEAQADFVTSAISALEASNAKSFEPQAAAEAEWCAYVDKIARMTLFPATNSWWTGGNVPGKKVQMLTYILGIDQYEKECRERLDKWQGFDVKYEPSCMKTEKPPVVNGVA